MKKEKYNIAIVGATGLVGRTMLKVLEEQQFPVGDVKLFASERSIGTKIFNSKTYNICTLSDNCFENVDIALFSAGSEISLKYAPLVAKFGGVAIDNSSAWRMDSDVPLVVPEVNPEEVKNHKGIIANPNCSTIQLVVALKPIQDKFKLKRVVVSTYQSISGAGQKGVDQLMHELEGRNYNDKISKHRIAFNTLFHSIKDENGFSVEEIKMLNETKKIMKFPELKMSATCVRLPVLGGHAESVNIETSKSFTKDQLINVLKAQSGIEIMDDPLNEIYPTPQIANNSDKVFVGHIRMDESVKNGVYLWVVSDNVRKGAATNAVQIAQELIK